MTEDSMASPAGSESQVRKVTRVPLVARAYEAFKDLQESLAASVAMV